MSLYEKYPNSKFLKETFKSSLGLPEILEDLFSYLDGLEDSHFGSQLDHDCEARIWEMMVALTRAIIWIKHGVSKYPKIAKKE